jgi:hypothetical protein
MMTDLIALGFNRNTYAAWWGPVPIMGIGGLVQRHMIQMEMRLIKQNGDPITPWFEENGIITPNAPGALLLENSLLARDHVMG